MAYGICYTQSGNVKKYEPEQLGSIPMYVTGYTVGYPSTAYYSDAFRGGPNFYCFAYGASAPPDWPIYPGFTEGTAEYIYNVSFNGKDTYNKIYNLMTDTPPDGFVLDENGEDYVVTKIATVYSCNMNVEYGGVINSINGGTQTIEREFKYKKEDKPDTYINYYVTFTLNSGMLNCKCDRVTNIPGTNNGNVTFGIEIELGDGKAAIVGGRSEWFEFSWVMKDGIDESKSCSVPYYLGSGFTTKETWEIDNGDGTKTYYRFQINRSAIPDPPHS